MARPLVLANAGDVAPSRMKNLITKKVMLTSLWA
jgi:hypothetical protein